MHTNIRVQRHGIKRASLKKQQGLTLIELIISSVIISIAIVGVMTVYTRTILNSADPLVKAQALAIAESYMTEILMQPYADPDGVDNETDREDFDDVTDYDVSNYPAGPAEDQYGNGIGVNGYTVSTSVGNNTVNGAAVRVINVSVTHPAIGSAIALTAYRANY